MPEGAHGRLREGVIGAAVCAGAGCVCLWPSSGAAEAVGILLGLWGAWHWRESWAAWKGWRGGLMAAALLWATASCCWAAEPSGAWRDWVKGAGLALGAFGMAEAMGGEARRGWKAAALFAGWTTAALGMDLWRLVAEAGWPEVLRQARYIHPYLYTHPNVSSLAAGLALVAWAGLAWAGKVRGWRGWLAGAAAAVDAAYLWVQGSRGPQIVTAAGLLALPLVLLRGWKRKGLYAVVAVALGAGLWAAAGWVNPRMHDDTAAGFHGRDLAWRFAAERVAEKPWAGWGYGKRCWMRVAYGGEEGRPVLEGKVEYPHAHGYWLMAAFGGGAVGLALWGAAWAGVLAGLWRAARRAEGERRVLAGALGTGLAMVLVYGLEDYPDSLLRWVLYWGAGVAAGVFPMVGKTGKGFSNDWKKTGENGAVFPMIGKSSGGFSNDWKNACGRKTWRLGDWTTWKTGRPRDLCLACACAGGPGFFRAGPREFDGDETGASLARGRDGARPSQAGETGGEG